MILTKKTDMAARLQPIIATIQAAGGRVERYKGGVWSYPGVKAVAPGKLEWSTTTIFIEELVLTQVMEWTDFHSEGKTKLPRGAQLRRVPAEAA